MQFGQLIEYNRKNVFLQKSCENELGRLIPDLCFLDLPLSPDMSYSFSCVCSFVRPLKVFLRIGTLVFSDFLHEVRGL